MKTTSIYWSLAVLGAFVGGIAVSAQLQSPTVASDPMDAVVAAPKNHRVLYEDEHVRVLEVTVQPGELENVHAHRYPSVIAYDAPQPRVMFRSNETGKDDARPRRYDQGEQLPASRVLEPQGPHQTRTDDSFPQHFYRIEFKRMDGIQIMKKKSYP